VWGGGEAGFTISNKRSNSTGTKKKNVNLAREFNIFSDEWKNVS
jgi:hypothetical protein